MRPLEIDKLQIHFDPPVEKKPRRGKRSVSLIDDKGMILEGIVVHYHAGASGPIEIPEVLTILTRPEREEKMFTLSDLDREALRHLIRDRLRSRPETSPPDEWNKAGESVRLFHKAQAARRGRRN